MPESAFCACPIGDSYDFIINNFIEIMYYFQIETTDLSAVFSELSLQK